MKEEKLGIRCGALSERHRLWGECYMTDIDHIVSDITAIEYNDKKAVALIEYKFNSNRTDLGSASIAATEDLANRASLPFFIVQYDPTDWEFYVRPRNEQAQVFVPKRVWMTEQEYVCLLHRLRGKTAPDQLLETLNGPPSADSWEIEWTTLNPPASADEITQSLTDFLGEPWIDEDEENTLPCSA